MKRIVLACTALALVKPVFAEEVSVSQASEASAPASVYAQRNTVPSQQYVQAEDDSSSTTVKVMDTQSLQEELQALRGQVEELQHAVKILEAQNKAFYRDLDDRLNHLVGKQAQRSDATTTATKQEPQQQQQAATQTAKKDDNDPSGMGAYADAYDLVRAKDYQKAVSAFESFVASYPNSELLPNAHYWLGELSLAQNEQNKAQQQFQIIINNYPLSNKIAGARLKLAIIHMARGNNVLARNELNRVIREYPDTAVAQIARNKLRSIQ